ncbi:MAG: phosphatidylserine/phosphatidylglycerophosphate/cardiolipin synthase family protein [Candidatus Dormibacterales bacterium]
MAAPLDFFFLTDGGQPATSVAQRVAAFLDGASKTLDIAIYDLRLDTEPSTTILAAFAAAQKRGVTMRLLFNQDHAVAIPVPPPPEIDWAFIDRLRGIGVQVRPVPGVPDLMHHKYVVRDAGTPAAATLTGSTNWTNDSWTREENVMFTVASADVTAAYAANFQELWDHPVVAASGRISTQWMVLQDSTRVRPYFCPGRGLKLVHAMARSLASATRRIRICSPVITSGPILGTLADICQHSRIDIGGVYDATQMDEVQHQWADQPGAAWKVAAFRCIASAIPFGTKHSTPYSKTSVHDFMHAKVLVADDYVYAGSFNLSHSGEQNAENVIQIESASVAEMCAQYIDRVAARYGGRPLEVAAQP